MGPDNLHKILIRVVLEITVNTSLTSLFKGAPTFVRYLILKPSL